MFTNIYKYIFLIGWRQASRLKSSTWSNFCELVARPHLIRDQTKINFAHAQMLIRAMEWCGVMWEEHLTSVSATLCRIILSKYCRVQCNGFHKAKNKVQNFHKWIVPSTRSRNSDQNDVIGIMGLRFTVTEISTFEVWSATSSWRHTIAKFFGPNVKGNGQWLVPMH